MIFGQLLRTPPPFLRAPHQNSKNAKIPFIFFCRSHPKNAFGSHSQVRIERTLKYVNNALETAFPTCSTVFFNFLLLLPSFFLSLLRQSDFFFLTCYTSFSTFYFCILPSSSLSFLFCLFFSSFSSSSSSVFYLLFSSPSSSKLWVLKATMRRTRKVQINPRFA